VADDEAALQAKLAALEAEVKADADAQRARKDAALAKAREQRAKQLAEQSELRERQTKLVARSKQPARDDADDRARHADADEPKSDIEGALELAGKANRVKQELARKPQKGEKSWVTSGIVSAAFGPLGWLYAGSFREAIPAGAVWIAIAAIASKILPMFLLMWPMMVLLPLSGIAGIVYALQYNRHGGRQRIFGDKGDKKSLKPGDKPKQLRG
jgi:hypothetical protein